MVRFPNKTQRSWVQPPTFHCVIVSMTPNPIFEMGLTGGSTGVATVLVPLVAPIVGTNRIVGKTRERLSSLSATTIRFAKPFLPWNPRRSAPRLLPGGPPEERRYSRIAESLGAIYRLSPCGRECPRQGKNSGYVLLSVSSRRGRCAREVHR